MVFHNFRQVTAFPVGGRSEQEVIDNEQLHLGQCGESLEMGAISPGLLQDLKESERSARLHPMQVMRKETSRDSVMRSSEVISLFPDTRMCTAGYVVCRQASGTAKGHAFLTLEEEEGLLNIVLKPHIYQKYHYLVRTEPLIVVEEVLQKKDDIVNIVAEWLATLEVKRGKRVGGKKTKDQDTSCR